MTLFNVSLHFTGPSRIRRCLPLPPPCRNRRPVAALSPPETTTHHYAAQKTDSSPAISVWNNVAIAHAKERYGYQPETVQDVDVLVVVVPDVCNISLTIWMGEGGSSEGSEWLRSIGHRDYLLFTWSHPWLLLHARRLSSKARIM